jgi:hypothetical protein
MSTIEVVSLERLKFLRPAAKDRRSLIMLLGPGERISDRQYSPMWYVQDIAHIPAEDTVILPLVPDVRYVWTAARQVLNTSKVLTLACKTGAHDSIALARALCTARGSRFNSSLPGRPALEEAFESIARIVR